jgi:hypothetical protein
MSETLIIEAKDKEVMPKFSRKEIEPLVVEYFNGDKMAADVWINKYCLKDSDGNLYERTPDDMHRRLAKEFARIEKKYPNPLSEKEIYDKFKNFKKIIPQGSVMNMLGNKFSIGSLSNCIVLPKIYDSYGGITYTDQQLTHLYKRRCVDENSLVKIKGKGLIKISEVNIGDYILGRDINSNNDGYYKILNKFKSDVDVSDRLKVTLSNGSEIKTSKKHPILVYNDNGYEYINSGELKINDVLIKPSKDNLSIDMSDEKDLNDIAWFIGFHLGDGNSGIVNTKYKKPYGKNVYEYKRVRIRCLGDNKETIENYRRIHSALTNSKSKVSSSKRKHYKSNVWEYVSTINKNKGLVEKYFDNQIGNKTYFSKTPKFVKENNLYLPFIAGLIDSDGYYKEGGSLVISLANKNLINELSTYLSSIGINYHVGYDISKRKNQSNMFRLSYPT